MGRAPAWEKCPDPECCAQRAVGLEHTCGRPFVAFWCLVIADADPDTAAALSHLSGKLQRSAFAMSTLRGVAGPFDATGVGQWFAARLRPQSNDAAVSG
jgi:hypothetical protein